MNHEEHDELWELLGKAKQTSVSPLFSRNVLRTLRTTDQEPGLAAGLLGWLRARWTLAAATAGLVAILATVAIQRSVERPDPLVVLANQVSTSPDYQVISHLDELLDSEHNSVWLEASAY